MIDRLVEWFVEWCRWMRGKKRVACSGKFTQNSVDGYIFKGDLKMFKMTKGQAIDLKVGDFVDRKGNPAGIEAGTGKWSVKAKDPATGDDVSGDFSIAVDPNDETAAELTHNGKTEVEGEVVFDADGDTDADEYSPVQVVEEFGVDSENAVGGTMTHGEPHDVGEV